MKEIKNLAKKVRTLGRRNGVSRQSLVKRSGLSESTIYRIQNGDKKEYRPRYDTLAYLAHGLKVSLSDLVTQPVSARKLYQASLMGFGSD